MKLTITIPDDDVSRTLAAFCSKYSYQKTIINPATDKSMTNPEKDTDFFKRTIMEYIKEIVFSYESEIAEKNARKIVSQDTIDVVVS